jgi:predicted RNA-binding protein with PIN domain
MIIIVDGYNLLKQLHPKSKENLEYHKKVLLRELGVYKKIKGEAIKDIIVVFDGGSLHHANREVHHGIVMLESGYKRSADDWIIEYVDRYTNEEILVVSMDRALCLACEQHKAFSMGVFDFARAVKEVIQGSADAQAPAPQSDITLIKYESANYVSDVRLPENPPNLDDLMNQGAHMHAPKKISPKTPAQGKSTGPVSKHEKTLLKKMKKIY